MKFSAKEAIDQIKSLLFGEEQPPATPPVEPAPAPEQKMAKEYKLKDGTIVMVDAVQVGGIVTVNNEPAPDGEHELEDGTKLVTSGGQITEVKPALVAPVVDEEMKQLPAQFGEMKQNFAAQIDELKATITKQDAALKEMFSLLEKVAEFSQEQPIETPVKWEDMTPLQKFRAQKSKQN